MPEWRLAGIVADNAWPLNRSIPGAEAWRRPRRRDHKVWFLFFSALHCGALRLLRVIRLVESTYLSGGRCVGDERVGQEQCPIRSEGQACSISTTRR